MIKYSVRHFADFYCGLKKLSDLFVTADLPANFSFYLERIKTILSEAPLTRLSSLPKDKNFNVQQNLYFAFHLRYKYKSDTLELIEIFSRLDAWYSMAMAVKTYNLKFPEFIESDEPYFKGKRALSYSVANSCSV